MTAPGFLQSYLPSYDLKRLDKDSPSVAREIITQALNLGDKKAVRWVFDNYTLNQIRNVVKNPKRGVWGRKSLYYWKEILKIDDINNYEGAILNIYPV